MTNKSAEHRIQALEAELASVLDAIDQAVTCVDANGRVTRWNRAAAELYNIPPERILGRPITGFFAPASLMVEKVLRSGRSVRSAYHRPRPGTHVLITALPVRRGDDLVGAVAVERDVTRLVDLSSELLEARTHVEQLGQGLATAVPASGQGGGPGPTPATQAPGEPRAAAGESAFDAIRGDSPQIAAAIALARRAAGADATVLIQGETGTGKELFARAIHGASRRAGGPFVALNCGAIPSALFESELFGYAGGAFTGANPRGQPGKMDLAHGGTLFLDEVGDLAPEVQVKLLRALEDGRFYRVGGTQPVTVDVRLIAASNRDLAQLVGRGAFRADLFWRLNVICIELPPLRERPRDVWQLAELFLHEFSLRHGLPVRTVAPGVAEALLRHPWPGNVRELRNVVERLVVLADAGNIAVEHLPTPLRSHLAAPGGRDVTAASAGDSPDVAAPGGGDATPDRRDAGGGTPGVPSTARHTLNGALAAAARESIRAALQRAGGNRAEAARLLGISRGTLYYRLRQLELVSPG